MSNPISINIIPAPHPFQQISSLLMYTVGQQQADKALNCCVLCHFCPSEMSWLKCSLIVLAMSTQQGNHTALLTTVLELHCTIHSSKLIDYWKWPGFIPFKNKSTSFGKDKKRRQNSDSENYIHFSAPPHQPIFFYSKFYFWNGYRALLEQYWLGK